MAENGRRWQSERRQMEAELEELRAKRDAMQHWETQVFVYTVLTLYATFILIKYVYMCIHACVRMYVCVCSNIKFLFICHLNSL